MGSYEDFLFGVRNPLGAWKRFTDVLYERSHGSARAILESLPFTGGLRKWEQSVRKAEDHYNNTGTDPQYGYGTPTMPGLRELSSAVAPVKMARSLAKMYGAEVELDIAKERREAWTQSHKAANAWYAYEQLKQNRNRNE